MAETIIIRRPAPDEFADWLRLWQGYNAFYARTGPDAIPDTVTRTTWDRFFDPHEPVHGLVAERAGELVGMVHFIFHRNTTMLGSTCYLQDLFADPAVRGQGVGRRLIEAVYDQAREAGAPRVYWHTHETNATAMQLYDKVAANSGFVMYRQSI